MIILAGPDLALVDANAPRKLHLAPGQRVLALALPPDLVDELAAAVPGLVWAPPTARAGLDVVLWAPPSPDVLRKLFRGLGRRIRPAGAVWVFLEKKPFVQDAKARLTQEMVIGAGKSAGLVDNKVCRVDDRHYALRFVVPKAQRQLNRSSKK